jgi:chromosome segregation ATPase
MEEKTQLVAKVEELSKLLKESEHRVQNLTIELGKKSQKATQAASSVHILQTQVDRMRLEAEEAHANFERELNNLYCKIKEKDNQIEKLKTEVPEKGDKDRDLGHTGITLTDDFSEGSMFGSYIADLGQNNSVRSEADLSPRSRSVNMEINVENIAPLEAFSKKPGDAVTDTQKPQLIDKCTMTKEIREDPLSPNNTKMADMCEKINTLTLKIEALDNEVAHYRKMETVYKNTIKERDQSIADYEARLLKNTEEYIITMNDLNNEFEHLSMKYNKLKKR